MMKTQLAEKTASYIGPEEVRDIWLAGAAGSGDLNAQRELAERLFSRVRRTMSYLVAGDDTEDLAQTALIQVLSAAGTYRGDCTLEYWADRIVTRVFFKHRGKFKRRKALWDKEMMAQPDPQSNAQSDADSFELLQMRRRVTAILDHLSRKHRATVVLHYLNGYTVEEVATIEDVPVNTVRGRIRTARKKLWALMKEDPLLVEWMTGGES
jgi:RNA polymerase sigma-70 factor, ECF subfamily